MPRGVFRRLLITNIGVLVLVVLMISLLLTQFFKVYSFNEKQSQLIRSGQQIKTQLILYHRGDLNRKELTIATNIIGQSTNSRILIYQGKGENLTALGTVSNNIEAVLRDVLKGKTVIKRNEYNKELNTYVVVVGQPFHISTGEQGAIILFSPVYEVNNALRKIYEIIWLSALGAIVIGSIAVWLNARKISDPIIELTQMAQRIAKGQDTKDVSVEAYGEIQLLVNSFNDMKKELANAEKMRKEFIAGISHELRTPLTSIRGYIQGILDGIIPANDQMKYLRIVFDENNRLTRLTNDLLELNKLEAGAVKLHLEKVDLDDVLKECLETVMKVYPSKSLGVNLEIDPRGLVMKADPDRFKQIVINIIDNAYKYTPANGIFEIMVKGLPDQVILSFRDNGSGIPAEELPRIFDKFHRVDKARDASIGGTGLGLSIVKNLVELHGGTIHVESKIGKGTCFVISLPFKS